MNFLGTRSRYDLLNLKELDPPSSDVINDKREVIKFKFPFYRMEVRHFEILLEQACEETILKYIKTDDIKT
jgi:hypothetical protein